MRATVDDAGHEPLDRKRIAVANATGMNTDQQFLRTGFRHVHLDALQLRSDLGYDGKLSRARQHPENVWSLDGLHECLTRRGDTVEAPLIKARLDLALARAEVPVRASCLCRREAA
jgi:hypothetical protein